MLQGPMRKIIRIKFPPNGPWYEIKPDEGVTLQMEDERLVVEGVTLCLLEEQPR